MLPRGEKSREAVAKERIVIYKNVLLIATAFMVLFTAYQSMAALQSSINKVEGLGSKSLATIYISLIVSSLFVPTWLIERLKAKWAMVLSMLCYSLYIAAQFYPSFYTLIPAAVIIGVGAAPLWTAKCAYLSQAASRCADITDAAVEQVIARFFGIFFLFFQSGSIWGNIISSTILGSGEATANRSLVSDDPLATCGVDYCSSPRSNSSTDTNVTVDTRNDNLSADPGQVYILVSVFLACSLAAPVLVAVFVDPLERFHQEGDKQKLSGLRLLVATITHMRNPYQLLIIPLTVWSGFEQGFFSADFTAGYVSCAYGVENVGFVLLTYAISDAVFSLAFGAASNVLGRMTIFVLGAVINIAVILVFFTWPPHPSQAWVLFILSALWGVADAVWQTQINALYGSLFESQEEAGFSNYRLWESFGFFLAYLMQAQVCVSVKLWVLTTFLVTGMAGYLAIEALLRVRKPERT